MEEAIAREKYKEGTTSEYTRVFESYHSDGKRHTHPVGGDKDDTRVTCLHASERVDVDLSIGVRIEKGKTGCVDVDEPLPEVPLSDVIAPENKGKYHHARVEKAGAGK